MLENQEQTLIMSAAELLDLMQTESVQLLDVRDPEEYSAGHIDGAINCPMDKIDTFDGPVDQHYLLICKSGKRSKLAKEILSSKGFKANDIAGGMDAWDGSTVK
ncbi:TPA: rhodanese-like domain-containing protein [Streptococcus suis]|uniref:rhodanese-like domain-containing protein n=1 Tax=Streptococcus suis TaxID=1307 RepID=UPI001557D8CD|nr:rhodanese-like domain-containing protein [Streptococcus suis]MBY4990991.1 rhodanese-like domain-containing protein [Streptococcus suis]NQL53957.1 rhodanese-like domain-containing protein [Streptococcus suis]NQM23885.1 rhodanese-like domain-containing protein [Streptococcus suis]HEL1619035.1 rhodanese-like domain-containing protein [Streptococcus suis]HEM2793548.1 rhodanese-like domain-containing protein [Streptococcus suis]